MKKTKILIIRFRRVGDAVLSSSLCTSLKNSIPNSEIHYVLNEGIAPLFEHHPAIDKVISFSKDDHDSFSRYIKKIRKLVKAEKYDIIIDARTTMNTLPFALFSLGSKYRIGKEKSYNRFIHNYRVFNEYKDVDGEQLNNVELTLELLNPLMKEFDIKKDPNFKLYYSDEEHTTFRHYMEKQGIDFSKPVILCAAAARLKHKIWSLDKMKLALSKILDKYDAQIIFNFGDKAEQELSVELHETMDNDPRVFSNIEAKSLRELVAMMSNCDLFFGNEGGPRHIAQALDIPSFAIFPPVANKKLWLPLHSDRHIGIEAKDIDAQKATDSTLSYEQKFEIIDVNSVWIALDEMLSKYLPQAK